MLTTKIEDIIFALGLIKDFQEDRPVIRIRFIPFSTDKTCYGEKLLKIEFLDGHSECIELP